MENYLTLLKEILENGTDKKDRTGTGTKSLFGRQLRFDLSKGFPLITTREINTKAAVYELLWYLSGNTNVKNLNEQGVNLWDKWADEKGNLGPIYGAQWRAWQNVNGKAIDQISNVVEQIKKNPDSRRLIVSAWNVGDLEKMAIPSCCSLFQFYITDKKLSCQLYQRSADYFLGVPINIITYSLLTHMVAQVTGNTASEFIQTFGDVHLYKNHIEQAKTQLEREPRQPPLLKLNKKVKNIFDFKYEDIEFLDYNPHPKIKASVSV